MIAATPTAVRLPAVLPLGGFRLTQQYQPYVCIPARDRFGGVDFDCFKGSEAPFGAMQPDLYCSGTASAPTCSDMWYPEALAKYNIVDLNGSAYVCTPSNTSVGDQNCAGYKGVNDG